MLSLMSNAVTALVTDQHSEGRSHELRVGMSVFWIRVRELPPEPGVAGLWFRWESDSFGAVGQAKTVAHCLADARLVLRAREREENIGPAIHAAFAPLAKVSR